MAKGRGQAGTAGAVSKKMHDIDGELNYLNMDEPVTYGHLSPQNKCPQAVPELAETAASRIAIYKSYFPDMAVNLIDIVSSRWPTQVGDTIHFVDLLGKRGVHVAYFIADVQWNDNWQPVFEQLAIKLHARGIKVGLYCNGLLKPTNDLEWNANQLRTAKRPATTPKSIPTSLSSHPGPIPTHLLPEDQPGTQTHIGKELIGIFP